MTKIRFNAINAFGGRPKINIEMPAEKISDFYASYVFSEKAMKEYLSKDAMKKFQLCIKEGNKVDNELAEQIANAMKLWAMKLGATHYTHWFQPLTGTTAEKHDSFFIPNGTGGMEEFSSEALIQAEPDASSFPNGGIRATFEARGYTAWDLTSPAFIMAVGHGKTLCIPTIFISYNGESLDFKAPLLKSSLALEHAAVDVCHYFDRNVSKVQATLGWEQEYFLVDSAMYYSRPDLVMSGRTLVGRPSPKGQQLEDHYFGSIPERVYSFMREMESESLKLGIPVRTRHNEVAPSQFECAPMFEEVNTAVDHNSLLMDVMDRVSSKHKLKVLFHEKPFAGINGSGKHNNWSMSTDLGKNLLTPGKTPRTNLQFLTFFINTIAAVNKHEALLRATVASHGNDHRLGANEAPPAIISIFIGTYLKDVLKIIEDRIDENSFDEQDNINLRLDLHNRIPDILKDNTDRNRTSPFAFTGNKFEIRAVGSSANCALPMTIINTIVADQLKIFKKDVDTLIKEGDYKDVAILKVLRRQLKESKRIIFEGDNYGDEWHKEAEKRGLSNNKTTPEALEEFISEKSIKLFEDFNIYTKRESLARFEIMVTNYTHNIQIEARVLSEIVLNQIVPAAVEYQSKLIKNILGIKEIGLKESVYNAQSNLLETISNHIEKIIHLESNLKAADKESSALEDVKVQAKAYCHKVKPLMDEIRIHCDELELFIDDDLWPLAKYREMLFSK